MTTIKNDETRYRERKNRHKGSKAAPSRPGATKLKARDELRAMAASPPEPTTVDEALGQCIEANRAWRKKNTISPHGRSAIRSVIMARRQKTFVNLLAVIDPDPLMTRQDDLEAAVAKTNE